MADEKKLTQEEETLQNNNDNSLPVIQLEDFDRNEIKTQIQTKDGIEVLSDDSLENYSEKQEEDPETFNLTFDELKKYLRMMRKKDKNKVPVTDEIVSKLTEKEIEEVKKFIKLRDRKALIRFVNKVKNVSDEEAEKLTKEDFLEMTNKALVMSKFLKYNTKKDFGVKYKKKRQRKNRVVAASRKHNRKK